MNLCKCVVVEKVFRQPDNFGLSKLLSFNIFRKIHFGVSIVLPASHRYKQTKFTKLIFLGVIFSSECVAKAEVQVQHAGQYCKTAQIQTALVDLRLILHST